MSRKPQETSINAKPSVWSGDIWRKWRQVARGINGAWAKIGKGPAVVTHANYYTPRPYMNEYDRGSKAEGFIYTINFRHIFDAHITK